jgi:hypothetical protein
LSEAYFYVSHHIWYSTLVVIVRRPVYCHERIEVGVAGQEKNCGYLLFGFHNLFVRCADTCNEQNSLVSCAKKKQ